MQGRIHQHLHRVRDVVGGERRAVGERDAFAQLEDDGAAAVLDSPRCRQLRLELLVEAIHAQQHAAGQIADRLRGVVIGQRGIEAARLAVQAEAEFVAPLRRADGRRESSRRSSSRRAFIHDTHRQKPAGGSN